MLVNVGFPLVDIKRHQRLPGPAHINMCWLSSYLASFYFNHVSFGRRLLVMAIFRAMPLMPFYAIVSVKFRAALTFSFLIFVHVCQDSSQVLSFRAAILNISCCVSSAFLRVNASQPYNSITRTLYNLNSVTLPTFLFFYTVSLSLVTVKMLISPRGCLVEQ